MKYCYYLFCLMVLSGCKVGPDYVTPPISMPLEYSEGVAEETFVIDDEEFCHWWTIFNDPFLDSLLE
jgi:multidrug efflux system outer membrane protein